MSAGQIVGGVVGAVIGFYAGGPVGALQGAALGAGVGGYLDPPKGPTVSGPRLNDLAVQTSTYGAFIPRVYGTIGVHGNLLWLENNQLKETVRKKKQGGKGGGSKTTVKTYSYSATFHLGLCEGPIAGVRRIWCADKLIYNAGSDDLETIIASNQNAAGFRIYLGTDDQLPDSRYEADVGVGNASAHRGMAYIAFYDFQLADYSNTLQAAQFKVEVVNNASFSVGLLKESSDTYSQPHSSTSFLPKPYFVSPEKIVFYAPQWSSNYPPSSSFKVYEIYTGGGQRDYSVSVSVQSGDVPPNGDSDDDSEYWVGKRSIFSGGGDFSGPDGYIQRRGGLYAGLSNNPSRRLYASPGATAPAGGIESTAACFAIYAGLIYALSSDGVRVYDDNLTLISTHLFGLPSMTYPTARAEYVDGQIMLYDGSANPKIYRLNKDFTGYELLVSIPPIVGNYYYSTTVSLSSGMLVRAIPNHLPKTLTVQWFNLAALSQGLEPISAIISSEVDLSGLIDAADIDVSALSSSARGYRVNGGSIRSALEPLQGAFPFDVIQSGYKIKCVPRGQASVATIPWEDLGATDGGEPGDILQRSREMDTQLPARTTIKYLDAAREYAVSEQYAERINTEAINRVDRDLPLVLTADETAGVAEVLQNLPWLERTDGAFILPPIYLPLEAADVVTVTTPLATYQLRLTEVNYTPDGRLECKAKPSRAALYTPNATGGEGVAPAGTIGLSGATAYQLLDIPVVDETLQDAPGITLAMTGYTSSWPGGVLFRSSDTGQTWADLQAIPGKCTLGYAGAAIPARSGSLIDRGSSLVVTLVSGALESITEAQMLVGANYAAYGVNGRWEIIRFQNAALDADGSYTLTTFVRGDRGTEQYTGTHQSGDVFVLLDDPDNAFVNYPTALIGVPLTYRGITSGRDIDSDSDLDYTYQGVNLECLNPVDAKAVRDASSNLTATFSRRSRLSSSWWTNGVQAPIGETSESYEIDVMSGSAVVRTIAVSAPAFSYSAAQQTTDFGSPQSSIVFRLFQLSGAVGRGYQLQVTL